MKDFLFHLPTKIYFGKDADKDLGQKLKPFGAKTLR